MHQHVFFGASSSVNQNVFMIEILSRTALSLNGSAMQNTFQWHVCLRKWEFVPYFAHIPLYHPIHLFLSLSLSLALSLALSDCKSHLSLPVVLCYQFRGGNRLSPCSHNQCCVSTPGFSLKVPMQVEHLVFTK